MRPDNGNAQLAENVPSRSRRSWAVSPKSGACPDNGSENVEFTTRTTATNGKYTVALHDGRCSFVTAHRTKDGKVVWSAVFDSVYALVSDGTYVYVHWRAVVDDSMEHFVSALKISDGKVRWTRTTSADPDELSVGSGVVAHGPLVFDLKTGRLRLDLRPYSASDPRTLAVKSTLFLNDRDAVEAWTTKGKLLWRHGKGSSLEATGAGTQMPQYHAGRIYIHDASTNGSGTLVLDEKTGRELRSLPHADQPMAFDGRIGILTTESSVDAPSRATVSAVDLEDGYVYWTRTYTNTDGRRVLRTPPVIENGLVWFGLADFDKDPMRLVAIDEVSGTTRARIAEKCRLAGHTPRSYYDSSGTIGIAQHRLFVPSACGLQTYVSQK